MRTLVLVLCVALLSCGSRTGALSAGSGAPSPLRAPTDASVRNGCSDPVKCSTPPPGYTPYPGPPCDFPLTTPDEIRLAAAQMHAAPGDTKPGSLAGYGEPLLVHPLRVGDPDEWVVPTLDGQGGATGVIAVGVRANGRGCGGMASGWSGPFPRPSLSDARQRAGGPNDPVLLVEAVYLPWTRMLPPSEALQPVWRLVRRSGHEVFLFYDGTLYEGERLRAMLASYAGPDGLRGDRATSTPRPSPTFAPRYSVATASEVSAGLRSDPFVIDQLRYLRAETGEPHVAVADPHPGTPLRSVGLHKPYTTDLWIVPILDQGGSVVTIVTVSVGGDGLGNAIAARGWAGPFPRVDADDAKRRASVGPDPATSAVLGWIEEYYASPAGASAPCWLVTRRSGAQLIVTEDGVAVPLPKL